MSPNPDEMNELRAERDRLLEERTELHWKIVDMENMPTPRAFYLRLILMGVLVFVLGLPVVGVIYFFISLVFFRR